MALLLVAVAPACKRSATRSVQAPVTDAAPAPPPERPADDPAAVVATVDLEKITLGHLKARLAGDAPTPARIGSALVAAATDVLVLREGRVLKLLPESGETPPETSDRLLTAIFSAARHCGGVGDRDLKLAYMDQLARFKHPASWTVWTALSADPARARQLARKLRRSLPAPPHLPLSTTCTLDDSPVLSSHAKAFEAEVAELAAQGTGTELRRYTFFAQDDPQIPAGHFRGTDPAVARAVAGMAIGGLTDVVHGVDGHHVVLLVCRDRRRFSGLDDPGVKAELRRVLCKRSADLARQEYLGRLTARATVRWHRDTLRRAFGDEVVAALPPDSSRRERPVLP